MGREFISVIIINQVYYIFVYVCNIYIYNIYLYSLYELLTVGKFRENYDWVPQSARGTEERYEVFYVMCIYLYI